jgi:NitT/TauT family transport system substrate-binding protein
MEGANGVDTSKLTYADTSSNKYAEAANELEGTAVTSSPAGSDG